MTESPAAEPTPEPTAGQPVAPPTTPLRAFAVYSALRLVLLLVCFLVVRAVLGPENGLLVVGAAVLMSALLGLVLLRRQRDAFTAALMARTDERRAAQQARRERLQDPDAT